MRPADCRGYCARSPRSSRRRRRCWRWMAAAPTPPSPSRRRPGCLSSGTIPGRAAAINRGVQEATAPIICVLHADTLLPDDAVAVMRRALADPGIALAGFTTLLSGPDKVRWGTSFHNWIKTWYAPLLFRPHLFLRGVRLLFGDHAMFFRRADFLAVGGCDPRLLVMEEADLCIRFHRLGHTRLVNRVVITSDRRVAAWGALRT